MPVSIEWGNWLTANLKAFGEYPGQALILLGIGGAVAWWFAGYIHRGTASEKDERITGFKEHVERLQAQIGDIQESINQYRRQLGIDPAGPHKFSVMRDEEVAQCAMTLAGKIHDTVAAYQSKSSKLHVGSRGATVEDRKAAWDRDTRTQIEILQDALGTYERAYKADAILLRDQLVSRGAELTETRSRGAHVFDFPCNTFGLNDVANVLESLAKTLPGKA